MVIGCGSLDSITARELHKKRQLKVEKKQTGRHTNIKLEDSFTKKLIETDGVLERELFKHLEKMGLWMDGEKEIQGKTVNECKDL